MARAADADDEPTVLIVGPGAAPVRRVTWSTATAMLYAAAEDHTQAPAVDVCGPSCTFPRGHGDDHETAEGGDP